MASTNYTINYNDSRFKAVEDEKNRKSTEIQKTYDDIIGETNKYYDDQINAIKEYEEKQKENQQANTDFAIEKINQQKEQAYKSYQKEQKGAYVDYEKAINPYGVNAEQMATQGLTNTGFSESSKVSMYNTYQNRVATAREMMTIAFLNYDNAITEAIIKNNVELAQIAQDSLYSQLQLALEGFKYKNELILQKVDLLRDIDETYYNRHQDVLAQINTENSLAEQIRQYNETLAFQKAEAKREQSNWEKEYALSKARLYTTSSSSKSGTSKNSDKQTTNKTKTTGINDMEGLGSGYDKLVSTAKNTLSKNGVTATKNLLAEALASGLLTQAGVAVILSKLGLNK